jgi:hypothetical protein
MSIASKLNLALMSAGNRGSSDEKWQMLCGLDTTVDLA